MEEGKAAEEKPVGRPRGQRAWGMFGSVQLSREVQYLQNLDYEVTVRKK